MSKIYISRMRIAKLYQIYYFLYFYFNNRYSRLGKTHFFCRNDFKILTNISQYAMNITFSIGQEMWVRESLNLVL